MKESKFTGICFLVSALLVSVALIFSAMTDRFYISKESKNFDSTFIFDKLTGNYYGFFDNPDGTKSIQKVNLIVKAKK